MATDSAKEPNRPAQAPLFLLSFRYRDELAAVATEAGWQVIAARRADNAEQRFVASTAMVVVVDARGAFEQALAAVRTMADAIEVNGAALLVIVSNNKITHLDELLTAGATHYLASPFKSAELIQSLRFAERHAVRLAGGWRAVRQRREVDQDGSLAWQIPLAGGEIVLSQALELRFPGIERGTGPHAFAALLPAKDYASGIAAMNRLLASTNSTAFTHGLPSIDGRYSDAIHHLRIDAARGLILGTIEIIETEGVPRGGRDSLTGVRDLSAARRWIETRITSQQDGFFILLLSISKFEMINTAFGREIGDQLLQTVARLTGRLVSETGGKRSLIARTAGAEFVIGIDAHLGKTRALVLAQHLVEQIERPMLSGAHLVSLSCRIAVLESSSDDRHASDILRRASAVLADAKQSDHAHIRVINSAEHRSSANSEVLQSDLRSALDNDEIELLLQPQVSIPTGKIVGVEALARWQHPVHGELGAATLFAVAEQSDYLHALSQHIQRRAVEQAAVWPEALKNLRLAVNVTADDISRSGFAENFLAMVDKSGFPRSRLTVEITENGLIEDLNAAATLLAALRAGGCRVAIDDFGTGYSSLAYLKALPLDYLKIDKKLAQDIAGSARDRIVVRGVIDMSRSLGLAVIAEGVETDEQLTLLAREGCNYFQGFLCAEPLGVAALETLVIANANR